MDAKQVYDDNVRRLSAVEQLRLATLILEKLTTSTDAMVELSDSWSDQDTDDLRRFSLQHAQQ